jgi:hypothetical protein
MKTLFICVLSIVVTGCAQVWCKPDASQQEFAQTKYECLSGNMHPYTNIAVGSAAAAGQYGAAAASGVSVNSGMAVNPYMFRACMEGSGYQLVSQKTCDAMVYNSNTASSSSASGAPLCIYGLVVGCYDSRQNGYWNGHSFLPAHP